MHVQVPARDHSKLLENDKNETAAEASCTQANTVCYWLRVIWIKDKSFNVRIVGLYEVSMTVTINCLITENV